MFRHLWFTSALALLLLSWMCVPAVAFEEADPLPGADEQAQPDQPGFGGAVVDDNGPADEEDEEDPEPSRDADTDFGFDGDDAESAAKAAAGVAAAGGLAMVGFVMVWFILYFGFLFFMIAFSMAVLVVTVLAIYDCARRDFPDPDTRALWCILIVLTRWIGALVYYVAVYRKGEPPLQQARGQG